MHACIYELSMMQLKFGHQQTNKQAGSRSCTHPSFLTLNLSKTPAEKYLMKRAPSSEMPQKTKLFLAESGEVGVKQLASLSLKLVHHWKPHNRSDPILKGEKLDRPSSMSAQALT